MYFSGENSSNITYDDLSNRCIRVNQSLYARVQDNNKQSMRVILDTHLLKIRIIPHNQKLPTLEHIVSKNNASVSIGPTTVTMALKYVRKRWWRYNLERSAVTNSKIHIWFLLKWLLKIQISEQTGYKRGILILREMPGMWKTISICIPMK